MLLMAVVVADETAINKKEGELNPDLTNPGSFEFPGWFKISFLDIAEDIGEAADSKKKLFLFFYQDGCPYCEKTIQVNFAQKEIAEKTQANFDTVAMNMWGDREVTWVDGTVMKEKQLAAKLKVMFTPTIIMLDENQKVALRVNGYFHPNKFKAALDYVAENKYKKMKFSEYFAEVKPVKAHGKLHQQEFIDTKARNFSKLGAKPYMVLFEQLDCPACDELHGDILKRKETLKQIKPFHKVVQLDMWSKEKITRPDGKKTTAHQWAKDLDIKYAPSLVFFDEGKEVIRTEAYLKSFHVQSVMEYVSSKSYKKFPSFQRYIEERAEHLREKGVEVNLMQ